MDPVSGKTFDTINPTDESVICQVSASGEEEVELAVRAAKVCNPSPSSLSLSLSLNPQSVDFLLRSQNAFEKGEWGKMNARDRGKVMYR